MKYEVGKIYQSRHGAVYLYLSANTRSAFVRCIFDAYGNPCDIVARERILDMNAYLYDLGCVEITHITGLTIPSIDASTASTGEQTQ